MNATFTKLQDGSWGLRVKGDPTPGAAVTVSKRDGGTDTKTVGRVLYRGDGFAVCTIGEAADRPAPTTAPAGRTSRLFRDVKVGAVVLKGGKRYGVVTEVDAADGFAVVKLDRAKRTGSDEEHDYGAARGTRVSQSMICRLGGDADAPLQPTFSVVL